MSKIFVLLFAATLLLAPVSSYSLADEEYNQMYKNSSEFRNSEKRLKEAWKDIYGNTKDVEEKKFYLSYQREWIKSVRDQQAKELMDYGFSKDCAYARVNERRRSNLYLFARNFNLPVDMQGSAKTEDAEYDFTEDEIIPEHCKK